MVCYDHGLLIHGYQQDTGTRMGYSSIRILLVMCVGEEAGGEAMLKRWTYRLQEHTIQVT
jgi:hypothetical protein